MTTTSDTRGEQHPQLAQVALAVLDLPQICRFYVEGLGFTRAGGRVLWGPGLATVQGLGDDAAATLWWLVGRQEFVQLELFSHTVPACRPQSEDWRPSDLGWVRFGVVTSDFDGVIERLRLHGTVPLTAPMTVDGLRRVCIRDPNGVFVELLEDGPSLVGGPISGPRPASPAIRYAAVSVADLDRARRFFVGACGLVEAKDIELHSEEMESLWGLPGARRNAFVARGGDVLLEVVCYQDPQGRPPSPDHRLSDQGILNVAFAHRDRDEFDLLLEAIVDAGYHVSVDCPPGDFASTYVTDDQGVSVEIFSSPPRSDRLLGFTPEEGLLPGTALDPLP